MPPRAIIPSQCKHGVTGGVRPNSGTRPEPRTTRPPRSPESDEADLLAALAILDGIGAVPLARRVGASSASGGREHPGGPRSPTRSNPEGLTERQLDVLRLVADGLTNAQIADRLVLSVRTVDTHVAAVLAKLDVQSRQDAAGLAPEVLDLLE